MNKRKDKFSDPAAVLWMPFSPMPVSRTSAIEFDKASRRQVERMAKRFAQEGNKRLSVANRKGRRNQAMRLLGDGAFLFALAEAMKSKRIKTVGELPISAIREARDQSKGKTLHQLLQNARAEVEGVAA